MSDRPELAAFPGAGPGRGAKQIMDFSNERVGSLNEHRGVRPAAGVAPAESTHPLIPRGDRRETDMEKTVFIVQISNDGQHWGNCDESKSEPAAREVLAELRADEPHMKSRIVRRVMVDTILDV